MKKKRYIEPSNFNRSIPNDSWEEKFFFPLSNPVISIHCYLSSSRTHRRHESSRSSQATEEATGDQVQPSCPEPRAGTRYSRCKCMYICIHRARFDWWPASYQVFPSTNGPTAPAAGTHVGNRVNVRCPTTRNHFQRSIPAQPVHVFFSPIVLCLSFL